MSNRWIKVKNTLRFIFLIMWVNLMTYSAWMIITDEKTVWQTITYWVVFEVCLFTILSSFYVRREGSKKMIVFGDIWNVDDEV